MRDSVRHIQRTAWVRLPLSRKAVGLQILSFLFQCLQRGEEAGAIEVQKAA
jgi:hypothetical protein